MTFSTKFFKFTAICAFVAGVLWLIALLLMFGFEIPTDVDSAITLHGNWAFNWEMTVSTIGVFIFVIAMWGFTARKMDGAAGLATTGFIFAFTDFLAYAIGHLMIFVSWNPAVAAYLEEADEAVQANLRSNLLAGYSGAMDALFMTSMVCALIWMLLYAIATWKGAGLEKGISYLLFILLILSLLFYATMGLELAWLDMLMMIVYMVLFALVMFVLGAWLWKGKEAAR